MRSDAGVPSSSLQRSSQRRRYRSNHRHDSCCTVRGFEAANAVPASAATKPPLAFRYCGVRRDRQATVDHIDGLLSEVSIARSARTTRNRRRRGELRQDAIEQRLIATEYGNVEQVRTCVLRLELGE
jgi:hypothetical protein